MTELNHLTPLIDIALFASALGDKKTILVPNQRLAIQITRAWGTTQLAENGAWLAPSVYAIDNWLTHCWDELHDVHAPEVSGWARVSGAHNQYYWERAIRSCDNDGRDRHAKLAQNTYDTLTKWELSPNHAQGDSPSLAYFKRWSSAYEHLLKKNKLVSHGRSWEIIANAFQQQRLASLKGICIYGFQTIPPLQLRVMKAATVDLIALDRGSSTCLDTKRMTAPKTDTHALSEVRSVEAFPHARKLRCVDGDAELVQAVRWAIHHLKENPLQRIGIVVPDLNQQINQLQQIVDRTLKTESINIPVNFSAGTPLARTPIIAAAFKLLAFYENQKPLDFWIQQLYSPYSCIDSLPLSLRVDTERRLRKSGRFNLRLDDFCTAISRSATNIPETKEVLLSLAEIQDNRPQVQRARKTFSAWSRMFKEHLAQLQWPGYRVLDSLEYQQNRQWEQLLENFCRLDTLGIEVGISRALKVLTTMALEETFHAQTPDAPLQILGLLEAAGLCFHRLWVVGLERNNFPKLIAINPLLPAEFQRKYAMPHSEVERELWIANTLLQGFYDNSQQLILSFPQRRGEELLEESPLLWTVAPIEYAQIVPTIEPTNDPKGAVPKDHCHWSKESNIPLNARSEKPRGGASILRNQAICPFNAFAIHRLLLAPIENPCQGLSALQRGTLLHQAMLDIWSKWRSSDYLRQTPDSVIAEQLNAPIKNTLWKASKEIHCLRGPRYRQMEHSRLHKLITQWLEIEKQRDPFEVSHLEQMACIKLGGLTLRLALDRIDQVGGKCLILDYKSGSVSSRSWGTERLLEPQLPLYVVAHEPPANALAFAQIKGGEVKIVGDGDGLMAPILQQHQDWPQQVQRWREQLEQLAQEFTAGDAAMTVYDKTRFMQQRYLIPFNRAPEHDKLRLSDDGEF